MVNFSNAFVHAGAVGLEFVETVGHLCLHKGFWIILLPNFYIDLTRVYSYNIPINYLLRVFARYLYPPIPANLRQLFTEWWSICEDVYHEVAPVPRSGTRTTKWQQRIIL
jgi:hypothetical protein